MSDVFDAVAGWLADGRPVALARIRAVDGSAPRGPGAAMAVTDTQLVAGSLSGGCVEGALVAAGEGVLASGRIADERYEPDDEGWSVGLTCGGIIDVVVEPVAAWPPGVLDALRAELHAGHAVALATVADGGSEPGALVVRADGTTVGTLGAAAADARLTEQAGRLLADAQGVALTLGPQDVVRRAKSGSCEVVPHPLDAADAGGRDGYPEPGPASVFVQTWVPPDRLVVFGAVDFTAALVRMAKVMGFHVTVCDARPVFATPARFPEADEVVVDQPGRLLDRIGPSLGPRDAVCVLTHDVKFDVPAIVGALATQVGYVGAMGSRRTHADRMERLVGAGVSEAHLARLHSPIGLDLGGGSPGETAVSILAEIVAQRSGAPGPTASLRDTASPIHR